MSAGAAAAGVGVGTAGVSGVVVAGVGVAGAGASVAGAGVETSGVSGVAGTGLAVFFTFLRFANLASNFASAVFNAFTRLSSVSHPTSSLDAKRSIHGNFNVFRRSFITFLPT
jgi:hypothetical protein